ncbi:sensor histidine kinase [Streptomyces pini]|uniref:histidine kinase n=1 Tax=Streptomyces pini TaxID=1520580 RepID=A0A1I4I5R9_9ACTN|nr:ATP-binding protein [Streptomyces pini]SFL49417.1 Histidine kinase-, DNA gyrase B-, and HSP90-like ATPase [Streptomyces pini]
MSDPAAPGQHRVPGGRLPLALLAIGLTALVAGGAAGAAAAPDSTRPWVLGVIAVAGAVAVAAFLAVFLRVQRMTTASLSAATETAALRHRAEQRQAYTAHLADSVLPAVAERLRAGARPEDALAGMPVPEDPPLQRLLHSFAYEVSSATGQRLSAQAERDEAARRAQALADGVDDLLANVLPGAFERLRGGASAGTALAKVPRPDDERLAVLTEFVIREYATSERRSAAARTAGTKALSRVQAAAVSMLADLREMQERHGEEVFGDLLRLDHSTSQVGLLTDRLALLMGGRASRAWNKPIVMESILRGAVGRIAAYQRVRMHCASSTAIAGFAAEGVMHLLAELIDNAANFSPPIDEVNVYVEERTAGLVVTIEDSGLRMSDAAMRRAEKAVSGDSTDLAHLQGTRLGLAVVGLLAHKYGISVSYRPSSRGGTGVVVLLPPHLLAQQRAEAPPAAVVPAARAPRQTQAPAAGPALPAAPAGTATPIGTATAAGTAGPTAASVPPDTAGTPAPAAGETTHGLPVRPRGRTLARADRARERAADASAGLPQRKRPARDAGASFGAFHRSRRPENPSE